MREVRRSEQRSSHCYSECRRAGLWRILFRM